MSTKEDDFLPPLLPTDNLSGGKKSTTGTILVWLVLLVVLATVYQLVRGPTHATHAQYVHEACETSLLASWGPVGFLFVLVGLIVWVARRARGHVPAQEEAMLAHADGDGARARSLWLELAKKQRGNASHMRVSLHNAAIAALSLGDFDRARDELLAVERGAGFLFVDGHRLLASIELTRLFVLRGDLDRAQAWLRSSRQRLERYRHDRTSHGMMLQLTQCLLLAREGKHDEALQLLQSRWRRQLVGPEPGVTLFLRAYLVARTSSSRESGAATPWIDAVRTAGYDVAFLWKEWPDLEAFAIESGLASRAASTAHA